jgi:hypothetical protein
MKGVEYVRFDVKPIIHRGREYNTGKGETATRLSHPEGTVNVTSETVIGGKAEDQQPVSEKEDEELRQRLTQLRDDVSCGRVEEARAALKDLEVCWPESKRVQYWARVLAPPTARTTSGADPRSRPLDRERAWLREHARAYPGCWLAVHEDRLIAADPDLDVVLAQADQTPEGQHALLYQQPGRPTAR